MVREADLALDHRPMASIRAARDFMAANSYLTTSLLTTSLLTTSLGRRGRGRLRNGKLMKGT